MFTLLRGYNRIKEENNHFKIELLFRNIDNVGDNTFLYIKWKGNDALPENTVYFAYRRNNSNVDDFIPIIRRFIESTEIFDSIFDWSFLILKNHIQNLSHYLIDEVRSKDRIN